MADITTLDRALAKAFGDGENALLFVSSAQTVASGDDIILTEGTTEGFLIPFYAHVFLGVQFFAADGTTPAVPTAGAMTVSVQTHNTKVWESPPTSNIDPTGPVTVDWSGNTYAIRVSPAALDVADNWRMYVTANKR